MPWANLSKVCLIAAAVFLVLGLLFFLLGKLNFQGLPGDIFVKKGNFSFYFPIVSCIVVSLILTLILNLFRR